MVSRPYTSLAKELQIKVDNSYVSDILPLQLIYGGNTWQRLPRFKFPEYFPLSVNLKHFSNTAEPIKHINEIGLPYVNKQREKLDNNNQAASLYWMFSVDKWHRREQLYSVKTASFVSLFQAT